MVMVVLEINMKLNPINSSNIKAIGWENNTLHIQFRNGSVYEYKDVPKEEYDAMLKSDFVGSYYHKNIKGNYTCNKL